MSETKDTLTRDVNKLYGYNFLRTADQIDPLDYISTNSLTLDFLLGKGLPKKKLIEIAGGFSAGKSTLLNFIMGAAQQQGNKVLLIDSEGSFDPKWAAINGVNNSELRVVQDKNIDKVFGVALKAAATGEFGMICIDSIADLLSNAELDDNKDATFSRMGGASLPISVAARKFYYAIQQYNICGIFANQIRADMNNMYNPIRTFGGYVLMHLYDFRLMLTRNATKSEKEGNEWKTMASKALVQKTKLGNGGKEKRFGYLFIDPIIGVDTIYETATLAKENGVINTAGNIKWANGELLQNNGNIRGWDNLIEALHENNQLYIDLYNKTKDNMNTVEFETEDNTES